MCPFTRWYRRKTPDPETKPQDRDEQILKALAVIVAEMQLTNRQIGWTNRALSARLAYNPPAANECPPKAGNP